MREVASGAGIGMLVIRAVQVVSSTLMSMEWMRVRPKLDGGAGGGIPETAGRVICVDIYTARGLHHRTPAEGEPRFRQETTTAPPCSRPMGWVLPATGMVALRSSLKFLEQCMAGISSPRP